MAPIQVRLNAMLEITKRDSMVVMTITVHGERVEFVSDCQTPQAAGIAAAVVSEALAAAAKSPPTTRETVLVLQRLLATAPEHACPAGMKLPGIDKTNCWRCGIEREIDLISGGAPQG